MTQMWAESGTKVFRIQYLLLAGGFTACLFQGLHSGMRNPTIILTEEQQELIRCFSNIIMLDTEVLQPEQVGSHCISTKAFSHLACWIFSFSSLMSKRRLCSAALAWLSTSRAISKSSSRQNKSPGPWFPGNLIKRLQEDTRNQCTQAHPCAAQPEGRKEQKFTEPAANKPTPQSLSGPAAAPPPTPPLLLWAAFLPLSHSELIKYLCLAQLCWKHSTNFIGSQVQPTNALSMVPENWLGVPRNPFSASFTAPCHSVHSEMMVSKPQCTSKDLYIQNLGSKFLKGLSLISNLPAALRPDSYHVWFTVWTSLLASLRQPDQI